MRQNALSYVIDSNKMTDWLLDIFHHAWIVYTLLALYVVTVASAIAVVVSENRNPVKSLAWITVLVSLPGFGFLLYIIFGRSIKNVRMISRHNRRKLRRKESYRKVKVEKLGYSNESQQEIQMARALNGSIFYPNNGVEIFTDGKSKFESLLNDIANAKNYINIQYYIISDDNIGKRVQQALIAKAREGLTVRVIYDSVGSYGTSKKFFEEMKDAGIQVYPFFKVVFPPFGTRINWRNHRKIVVIDGKIGYIGGMNIADRYIDGGKKFNEWRDTHLRLTGPIISSLQYSFAVDWNFMGRPLIEDEVFMDSGEEHDTERAGMQVLTSGPTSQWTNIALMFLKAIGLAKKRVFLQTPYFLPTDGLLKTLQSAALSGVDVRIMLPMKSDSAMLNLASFSYISECLQSGIKFYLYKPGMLHCKVLIVDDEFVSVGSANFDFRSFEHNFEANVQIYSKRINAQMEEIFMRDIKDSKRIMTDEWKKRSKLHRTKESIIRLFSPIL